MNRSIEYGEYHKRKEAKQYFLDLKLNKRKEAKDIQLNKRKEYKRIELNKRKEAKENYINAMIQNIKNASDGNRTNQEIATLFDITYSKILKYKRKIRDSGIKVKNVPAGRPKNIFTYKELQDREELRKQKAKEASARYYKRKKTTRQDYINSITPESLEKMSIEQKKRYFDIVINKTEYNPFIDILPL